VNNDIAVNIVTSLPTPNLAIPTIDGKVNPTAAVEASAKEKAPTPSKEVITKSSPTVIKTNSISGLAAGEEVIVAPEVITKFKTEELPKKVGPGKYVIQVGAFASEERAKGWIAKMKDQKIPNYVSNKTGADGVKLILLRAGPFTDKDAAEAAEKKLKSMGLSPRLVEAEAS
jgi:DedD protein